MQFGIFDQNDRSGRHPAQQFDERLTLAALYDELGFDRYQMSEHHGTPLSLAPSPSVLLAAISQRTQRLRFGPLVYLLPIYNPLRLTEEICMLDNMSHGRFEFGIGRGASPHELEYMGVNPEEAAAMYGESFEILKQGLTTGRLNFAGKYWNYQDVHLSVRPFQSPHPKVWYAVASPESAVWPARNDVNVICGGPPGGVRHITDRYRQVRAEAKPKPGDNGEALLGISRHIIVADTDEEARALAYRAWPVFHDSFIKLWKRYGTEPKNLKLPPVLDPMLESGMALVGSPDTVRLALEKQIIAGGLNYFSGIFSFGDLTFDEVSRSATLFAREVAPAIRKSWDEARHTILRAA